MVELAEQSIDLFFLKSGDLNPGFNLVKISIVTFDLINLVFVESVFFKKVADLNMTLFKHFLLKFNVLL